ncbi:hypothetical protein RHGRI_004153 [Rhododendron griersonianum]|uniref:Uncharacterized protein n=1 Tax=Rhododendron griersonianum TaxID=479676 RepID=A0AAV6L7Z4_9ERIC|nr:hypothetical protein RHGRI_004153 [Rhododendron griersonianum]
MEGRYRMGRKGTTLLGPLLGLLVLLAVAAPILTTTASAAASARGGVAPLQTPEEMIHPQAGKTQFASSSLLASRDRNYIRFYAVKMDVALQTDASQGLQQLAEHSNGLWNNFY